MAKSSNTKSSTETSKAKAETAKPSAAGRETSTESENTPKNTSSAEHAEQVGGLTEPYAEADKPGDEGNQSETRPHPGQLKQAEEDHQRDLDRLGVDTEVSAKRDAERRAAAREQLEKDPHAPKVYNSNGPVSS
jgi:hypothetical protein